jgi:hypothetical protein
MTFDKAAAILGTVLRLRTFDQGHESRLQIEVSTLECAMLLHELTGYDSASLRLRAEQLLREAKNKEA